MKAQNNLFDHACSFNLCFILIFPSFLISINIFVKLLVLMIAEEDNIQKCSKTVFLN